MAGRGVSLEPAPEPAYNTVHHVRPWLVKCKAGRALPLLTAWLRLFRLRSI